MGRECPVGSAQPTNPPFDVVAPPRGPLVTVGAIPQVVTAALHRCRVSTTGHGRCSAPLTHGACGPAPLTRPRPLTGSGAVTIRTRFGSSIPGRVPVAAAQLQLRVTDHVPKDRPPSARSTPALTEPLRPPKPAGVLSSVLTVGRYAPSAVSSGSPVSPGVTKAPLALKTQLACASSRVTASASC